MTEAEFQAACEKVLKRTPNVLWHHCQDPRYCSGQRGLPDLIVVGPGGVLFPELKTEAGQLSLYQRRWRWMLTAAGQPWCLYRPRDLLMFEQDVQRISYRPGA